jgi:hypothetical protein
MESIKLYRIIFYVGSGWNFIISTMVFLLIGTLPAMLHIDEPRYPIFIYFNLMSIFFFGIIQFHVARNLSSSRGIVKILIWAKLMMAVVFVYAMIIGPFSLELSNFLLPGIIVDTIFGFVFWRYLIFSRQTTTS